jgi:hypothetical protein
MRNGVGGVLAGSVVDERDRDSQQVSELLWFQEMVQYIQCSLDRTDARVIRKGIVCSICAQVRVED